MLTYTWVTLVFLVNLSAIYTDKARVCYYRNWAQSAKGESRFVPKDIEADLCTVINYASDQINFETLKIEGRQRNDADRIKELIALKKFNPLLKVQVTVGGWNHEKLPRFAKMVETDEHRQIFVESVIEYIKDHNLDGINVDWEYPGIYTRKQPHEHPELLQQHKKLFIVLLRELRQALDLDAANRDLEEKLTLTLAVPTSRKKIKNGYDIPCINKIVDSIDIMAYNLRGPWRKKTGCPTLTKGDIPNVNDTLNAWIDDGGMDPSKVNLGLASYGRTFKLEDKTATDIGVPTTGPGDKGPLTKKAGILAYYEICKKQWSHETSADDSPCGTPYASDDKNGVWVAYDDPVSVRNKIINQVNKRGLNGISFWALDFDDFAGTHCGEGKYPLLKAAVDAMNE